MRLSLTTSGLLDPRQLSSWSAERQRAIHAAVAKGMQSGGREVRDAARNQMRSAFTVKRSNFISSMGVKIFDKKQNELPALWVGSKIPWLGIHERGGTVSGNLLIPLLPNRIGPKRFKAAIDGLMRSGNAYFIEKNGRVLLMAENLSENRSQLTRFKRAERERTGTEMQRLLPAIQQAAVAIGPDAVLRVEAWKNELARTRLVVDEMAPLWNRLGESFGGALNAMLSGAQSWREALSNLFRQIADAFLQQMVIQPFQQWVAMQARMLAMKLGFIQQEQVADAAASATTLAQKSAQTTAEVSMDAAKAGAGAAASQASVPIVGPGLAIAAMVAMVAAVMALLGNVKKFAAGGLVSGAGTATSDSISARLSAGEYVVRAAAVRQVGVAFLDSLNGLSAWERGPQFKGGTLAFAAGGLVPEVKVPPAQMQANQAVRIVNAIDPGVTHDHLQTPAGERVIVNIIGRNARAIRTALQN